MSRKSERIDPTHVAPALRLLAEERQSQENRQREITAALHATARACGYAIGASHWQTYPMSFAWIAIENAGDTRAFLVSHEAPVAALSATRPDYRNLRFVDDPVFASAMEWAATDIRMLAASDLDQPLTELDRRFVVEATMRSASDMSYWKPATVGDVIFNWWD